MRDEWSVTRDRLESDMIAGTLQTAPESLRTLAICERLEAILERLDIDANRRVALQEEAELLGR